MAGNKTHEQQQRIIEERVDTSNAGDEFPAEEDLNRSEAERKAQQREADVKAPQRDLVDPDDRSMLRGVNQESRHHKERADDD